VESDASNATIPVTREVIERIYRLKLVPVEVNAGNAKRRYKVVKSDGPNDLVFQSVQKGLPMRDNNILVRYLKPAGRETGMPWMIRQGRSRIINLSSQAGFVALPTESVYCMTKAAIAHLTKCLAVEWRKYNIRKYNITVNAVAPTFIRTPGTESCLANPEFRSDVIERIAALRRIGEPMDVAGVVVFLASSAASLITGETILIDGGWTAR
jgi:NAD(P)-dependent dehydrogenase (short-subunit alcohol dehydrogenase family)